MTTALLSLFAACTNDDFVSYEQGAQSGDAAMRPTVDVTLNVLKSNGADTRLAYDFDEGYQWEEGKDVIGALLMDKVIAKKNGQDFRPHDGIEAWEEMPWVDRYALVDYVNTDYPFTLQENGEWKTDAKMLEGNYFFTFPFASYNGNREAIHSIGEQVQDGVTDASLAKAYAKNNFFIGFSRIHAGTEGEEVISSDLEMTPVLGALGVELINTGNQDFTVKKIILQSDAFHTLIKVNPTDANYDGENDANADTEGKIYNLDKLKLPEGWGTGVFFNYANYEEMVKNGEDWTYAEIFEERYNDQSLVNNTKKAYYNESLNYNRQNALRAVIEGIEGVDGADNRAELTVLNAPVMKANTPDVTQRFIIMTNIYEYTKTPKAINLYIYTDKGMVGPVNITEIQAEVDTDGDGNKNVTVITENPIREIAPGIAKKVTLQIDDNSNQGAWGMPIYNESDLEQFIEWNKGKDRTFTATLMNNVTLTKEMSEKLVSKDWATAKLIINTMEGEEKTETHKLILEEGVAKNILDKVLVRGYEKDEKTIYPGVIEVNNALELGSNSYVTGTYNIGNQTTVKVDNVLEVAEGAGVTVVSPIENKTTGDYKSQQLIIAENEGTVTLNAAVDQLQIAENKAEVNINANVTFIGESNKNLEGATITIGKGAIVGAAGKLTNNGKNDNPTEEEEANYAVIINNGTLTDFVNGADSKPWGKVIAGEGSLTNADKNYGIIEKSVLSAQVSVDKEDKGVISYTVTDDKTLKEIIDGQITKLVIDGGNVAGTAYSNKVAGDHTANLVKWIEVKGKGGSLGSLIQNRGANNQNYWTSEFPALVEVTTKANATFYDVNLGGSDKVDFNIEAATATIRGQVNKDKYNLDITLGSYDEKNYKGVSATLTLPMTTDELYAASIKENDESDDITAKVINNGFVELPTDVVPGIDKDNWTGVPAGQKPGETPDKVLTEENLTVGENSNYKTLQDLKNYLATFDNINALETITISMGVNMALDANKGSLDVLNGKDVIVNGGGFINVSEDMGLKCKSLTVGNRNCIVKGVENQPNTVVLTVETLNYSGGTLLLINSPYIKISQPVQVNTGSYITGGGTFTGEGGIVADDLDGNLVWWNQVTNKWTAF